MISTSHNVYNAVATFYCTDSSKQCTNEQRKDLTIGGQACLAPPTHNKRTQISHRKRHDLHQPCMPRHGTRYTKRRYLAQFHIRFDVVVSPPKMSLIRVPQTRQMLFVACFASPSPNARWVRCQMGSSPKGFDTSDQSSLTDLTPLDPDSNCLKLPPRGNKHTFGCVYSQHPAAYKLRFFKLPPQGKQAENRHTAGCVCHST